MDYFRPSNMFYYERKMPKEWLDYVDYATFVIFRNFKKNEILEMYQKLMGGYPYRYKKMDKLQLCQKVAEEMGNKRLVREEKNNYKLSFRKKGAIWNYGYEGK